MFGYRGWPIVAATVSGRGIGGAAVNRLAFRVYARTASVRAVALFVDVPKADARTRRRVTLPPCAPSTWSLEAAVALADAETRSGFGAAAATRLQLVVLALHADAAATPSASVRQYIDALRLEPTASAALVIEPWHARDLAFDPLTHIDVPRHRLATDAERARYRDEDLPLLRADDVCARWLGFREHDVVAIERFEAERGPSVYLRRVVAV